MVLHRTRGETWELVWRDPESHGSPMRSIAGFADAGGGGATVERAAVGARLIVLIEGTIRLGDGPEAISGVRSFVAGPRAQPVTVEQCGPWRGIEVGLSASAATALIGMPLGELAGAIVSLDVLRGGLADQLHDRLQPTTSWEDAFHAIDRAIEPGDGQLADLRVQSARDAIERSHGTARIVDLAEQVGWSRRHLASRFSEAFGMTPKVAARLFRFERAHRMLASGIAVAGVAGACGYFDQAHMHRDFALFGAVTPGQVATNTTVDGLSAAWPAQVT